MRARQVALSGTTGAQQRLRHGLGEHKPYRWHGIPGWNPARILDGSVNRLGRECKCGALPGERCRTRSGNIMPRTTHSGR